MSSLTPPTDSTPHFTGEPLLTQREREEFTTFAARCSASERGLLLRMLEACRSHPDSGLGLDAVWVRRTLTGR